MTNLTYKGKFLIIEQENKKILAVGDLHLGLESALNEAGVFVNRYVFDQIKKDLEELFVDTPRFDEIVLLGDIKHSMGTILREERSQFEFVIKKMKQHSEKITLIKGNHDTMLQFIIKDTALEAVKYYQVGDCLFIHGDKDYEALREKNVKHIIMGHLHPAVYLRDSVKTEKYKCFLEGVYKGKNYVILPSFSSNNEGSDPREFYAKLPWNLNLNRFNVIIVGENLETYRFGKLRDIE